MPRKAGDIPVGMGFPSVGAHRCQVIDLNKGKSSQKGTPQIEVTLSNGSTSFTDPLFVTGKAFKRLLLFARRVCGMPKEYELPDDDAAAAIELAKYIMVHGLDKQCVVIIEENEEQFIPTSGPDMGRAVTKKRKRVAFNGYEEIKVDRQPGEDSTTNGETAEEPLPF